MKTERVFICLFILSLAMKYFHIAGESVMLTFTLGGLGVLYILFGFYFFSYHGLRNQKLAFSIVSGFLLAIGLFGILFRLQYWPGGAFVALNGTILSLLVLLIAVIPMRKNANEGLRGYYNNMVIRSGVIFVLCAMLYSIPSETLVRIECGSASKLTELKLNWLKKHDNKTYKTYRDYLKRQEE